MRLYIAGPMSGLPALAEWPAINTWAEDHREEMGV